jgi:hypothetical protein
MYRVRIKINNSKIRKQENKINSRNKRMWLIRILFVNFVVRMIESLGIQISMTYIYGGNVLNNYFVLIFFFYLIFK